MQDNHLQIDTARALELVYPELRALAQSFLAREAPSHTLDATALVHEAYIRLARQRRTEWESESHFVAIAARMIRRVLIDHARAKGRLRRCAILVPLEAAHGASCSTTVDLLEIDRALTVLEARRPRHARVVEMRFFGGMTVAEIARVMDVSDRTIAQDWALARFWLREQLSQDHDDV